MDELHLLGVHQDGEHLLLANVDDQQRFRLPLNDALRAAVRWERGSRGLGAAAARKELRPRDVQAMIRAGATAQETAERASWSVDKVRRYESPILAERAYIAVEAGRAHLRTRDGMVSLAQRVTERLEVRGVSGEDATWDSWRDEDGQWTVEVRFAAGGRQRTASWLFDKQAMTVSARDDEARWLSEEETKLEPTAQHVVPTRGRVYDVEAEGGLRPVRPDEPTTANDEVDLMTAMRERSTARTRRRGQRKSPAASPTALPPLADVPLVQAPSLAELRYDPQTMPPPPAAHGEPDLDGIDGRPEPAVLADRSPAEDLVAGFDDDEPEPRDDDTYEPPVAAFYDSKPYDSKPDDIEPDDIELDAEPAPDTGPAVNSGAGEAIAALPPYSVASDTVDEPELPLVDGGSTKSAKVHTAEAESETKPETSLEPQPETKASAAPPAQDEPDLAGQDEPGVAAADVDTDADSGGSEEVKPRARQRTQPSRTSRSRRKGRASVPAWDDIVFGAKPGSEDT